MRYSEKSYGGPKREAELRAALEATPDLLDLPRIVEDQDTQILMLKEANRLMREALKQSIPTLELAIDISIKYEPCGYYCDDAVGHIDHKLFNWACETLGNIHVALAAAHKATAKED